MAVSASVTLSLDALWARTGSSLKESWSKSAGVLTLVAPA